MPARRLAFSDPFALMHLRFPPAALQRRGAPAWALAAALGCALAPAGAQPAAAGLIAPDDLPARMAQATPTAAAGQPPAYRLDQLIAMARESNPALAAVRSRIDIARAGLLTAGTRPNPEIELLTGRHRARQPGAAPGSATSFSVTQPFDRPALREARLQAAEAVLEGTRAGTDAFALDLLAELQRRWHAALRSEAELGSAREDLALADQIRERVAVRVGTGEAPRFELVRADTEQLNARRALQAAELRVQQALGELRRVVGPALPAAFALADDIERTGRPLPGARTLDDMRATLLERHPELQAVRAEVRAAQARVDLERQQRLPRFALRAGLDREPDINAQRIGVVVSVPVFDRRAGPIAEAEADLVRLRSELLDRELQLAQQLELAYRQVQIAAGQVQALEGGILRQAESAMRIAEAAYRAGERGVLEWLDAQRAFRQARNDLNAARHELRVARVELDRLQGQLP